MNKMKKLTVFLFLLLFTQAVTAQKVYFIYLQSETKQPFYLKMGGKLYSASAAGYLILSKLHDSTYNFSIGFPDIKIAEQTFTVSVNKKDHGYLVKNFGAKGWGLFDLQTLEVINSNTGVSKTEEIKTENKDVSVFTDILSKAADDPSLKEKTVVPEVKKEADPVVVKEEKKEPIKEPARDSAIVKVTIPEKNEEPIVEVKKEEVQKETKTEPAEEYKPSVVRRRSESSITDGIGIVYTDDIGHGKVDTIRILIPAEKKSIVGTVKEEKKEEKKFLDVDSVKAEPVKDAVIEDNKKVEPAKEVVTENNKKTEPEKDLVIENTKKADTVNVKAVLNDDGKVDTIAVAPVKTDKEVAVAPKVTCKLIADQNDFFKLRRSMASVASNDEMIDEAKKYFKTKCFTTQQIKNLSALFLDDEGKYQFFDVAYSYVADGGNFPTLQAELKDVYYVNRFKAMLR